MGLNLGLIRNIHSLLTSIVHTICVFESLSFSCSLTSDKTLPNGQGAACLVKRSVECLKLRRVLYWDYG